MERITWGRMQNPLRGILHGSAAVVATGGLAYLVTRAWGRIAILSAVLLYGLALVTMYTVSALYHSVPWTQRWKARMQRVDHSLIFLVVAGTFTPFALTALGGIRQLVALTLVWAIAVTGIVLKFALPDPRTWLSVTLQMAMGWSALIWLPWILASMGWGAVILIMAGGLCYTIGTIVYATKRPRLFPRIFSYHELFHILVIAGSSLHFWAIARYVIV
ncbi:MAG: hemolysin III family protein [Acidimicrobiia bacterium]